MVCLCVAACSIAAVKVRKVLVKLALTAGLYVWNAQCCCTSPYLCLSVYDIF